MAATSAPLRPHAEKEALDYAAPFLLEKLVKDRIVDDVDAGEALFTEVKRYLVLARVDRHEVSWEMYSRRVDEVWHQFILYTGEYGEFCDRYFGEFVHHRPSNAPAMPAHRSLRPSTFASFAARYQEMYGRALPECWNDANCISLDRRVINDEAGRLAVSQGWGRASLIRADGTIVLSVDVIALEAMAFVANFPAFYVRELPGDLTGEERCAIVETLAAQRILRVAP